jgi:hypothetical protein
MSQTPYEFGFLEECEARQLVRVKIEESGEWAIVGARDRPLFPLVVLTGADAPYCINLYQNGHIDGDFDTYAVLKCGTDYEIVPDHTGPCEIGVGQKLKRSGSFVLADASQYLLVGTRGQKGTRYFDILTGKLHGEPGGSTAWFAGWTLWSNLMRPIVDVDPLIRFPRGVPDLSLRSD